MYTETLKLELYVVVLVEPPYVVVLVELLYVLELVVDEPDDEALELY